MSSSRQLGPGFVRHLARRESYTERGGALGTPHPAEHLAGVDPLAAWRTARSRANAQLTADTLPPPPPPALAKVPRGGITGNAHRLAALLAFTGRRAAATDPAGVVSA